MNYIYPYYLTIEEYTEALNAAHTDYLKSTHTSLNGVDTHHMSDLAISSSAFFESAYLILDHISSVMHSKMEISRQDAIQLSIKYLEDLEVQIDVDEPLWHEPKKSKKFKKFKKKK
jgi:5-enolpyruvylshikimate-3-phosphate synthase